MISWLPIHCAAERGRYNSVRVLIENRSPIDPVDKNQQTPLHLAARSGHAEVVKLLLKHDAKIDNRASNGENCLDLAINTNQYTVATVLLNHPDWKSILRNAQHDEKTNTWDTPLRKLIRKMPDVALIVLNKCCIITLNKTEQSSPDIDNDEEKKHKIRKHTKKRTPELGDTLHKGNVETIGLIKDEAQIQKLAFIYTYEFLDDQFLLKKWKENERKLFNFLEDNEEVFSIIFLSC